VHGVADEESALVVAREVYRGISVFVSIRGVSGEV
jgi:hypothetical protein